MFEIIKSWQKAGWCSVSAILVFEKGRGGVEEEIVKSKDLSDLSERYITKIAANTIHQIGKRSGQMCSCGFSINNENFLGIHKYEIEKKYKLISEQIQITKIARNTIHQIGKRSGQICSCGFSINNENFSEIQKSQRHK